MCSCSHTIEDQHIKNKTLTLYYDKAGTRKCFPFNRKVTKIRFWWLNEPLENKSWTLIVSYQPLPM